MRSGSGGLLDPAVHLRGIIEGIFEQPDLHLQGSSLETAAVHGGNRSALFDQGGELSSEPRRPADPVKILPEQLLFPSVKRHLLTSSLS